MSNNQWPGPNGQPHQGYPQQPQQPVSGNPQPGYPQARPEYQQPQPGYSQPGYQQPQPGQPSPGQQVYAPYGPAGQGMPPQPPRNRNTGLIIVLVLVLIATAAFGTWWLIGRGNDQPAANPTTARSQEPSPTSTKEESRASSPTATTSRSKRSSPAPEMPDSFGDFTANTAKQGEATTYTNSSGDFFVAAHGPGESVEANASDLTDVETIDNWTCGTTTNGTMCLTEAHSGTLATLMPDKSASEVAQTSDLFLAAWQ